MDKNIDIVIKQFKEYATDNRNEQHYWENRPNPNAGTLEYAQKACRSAEENEQIVAWLEELKAYRNAVIVIRETLEDMSKRLKDSLFGDGIRFALRLINKQIKRDWKREETNESTRI